MDIVNKKLSVKFHVMDIGQSDVYLGIPFLQQYSAVLNFSTEQNSISLLLGTPVFSEKFIEIEPYTEIIISGSIQAPIPNESQGYCFPISGTLK